MICLVLVGVCCVLACLFSLLRFSVCLLVGLGIGVTVGYLCF